MDLQNTQNQLMIPGFLLLQTNNECVFLSIDINSCYAQEANEFSL